MISDHLEFVKRQADFNRSQEQRLREKASSQDPNSSSGRRARDKLPMHEWLADSFEKLHAAMLADIAAWESGKYSSSSPVVDDLEALLQSPTDIHQSTLNGLPEELIAQLQISDSDRFQWGVVDIINRTPEKTISLEVLLIALYKLTGKIYDRADLANRMSRLSRKGAAFPVQGRKAVYTTIPQNYVDATTDEEEAAS